MKIGLAGSFLLALSLLEPLLDCALLGEYGSEQHVVELEEITRPDVIAVVLDEGVPGWPRFPDGRTSLMPLLNRAFAHAQPELGELASDTLRTPKDTLSMAITCMSVTSSSVRRRG